MLPPLRAHGARLALRTTRATLLRPYSTADRTSDRVPTNDPNPPKPAPNVSETNALPISAMGLRDAPFQEGTQVAEERRVMQAPNRRGVWSRSQQPRERAMSGPRFEQTLMEFQVGFWRGRGIGGLVEWAGLADFGAVGDAVAETGGGD